MPDVCKSGKSYIKFAISLRCLFCPQSCFKYLQNYINPEETLFRYKFSFPSAT